MKKTVFTVALILMTLNIFGQAGTIPTGLSNTFGFGAIDKADSYAASQPQFWKDGQYSPCSGWDYSYQYLTPGWATWVAGGGWAKQELQYWEGKGQIQVFTFYYTPYTLSNYTNASWMNTYFNDFKLLMQVINANSSKVVIVHIEPDFLGYMRQKGTNAYSQNGLVMVKSSGFSELDDGVNINTLPDTLQGWSEALFRIRNQYAKNKVILAHHFTHWATGTDIFVDTQDQTTCNTNVDDMCTFIKNVENTHAYDLFFVDPADRDADWYRIKGGGSNTRWTGPTRTYTTDRNWGKISYITDRISTNLYRRGMFWQVPVGNTYYKTCNNADNHYRDNSAQEFLPSTTTDGSSGTPGDAYSSSDTSKGPGYWAQYGIIGVLFGEGGFDTNANPNNMTHLRDWPNDGITNPSSDSGTGGPSYDVWGKATSSVSDNEGGYIRAAVNKYCQVGKYVIGGAVATKTNTPVVPTLTFTRTNTPVVPTLTFTRTNTPVVPTSTFTSTFTPVPPTFTFTKTNTPVIPTSTFTFTLTPVPPTSTFTSTLTPVPPTLTFTKTSTPTSTSTFTSTLTPVAPTLTNTPVVQTATVTHTNTPTLLSPTNTDVVPSKTYTTTRTQTPTNTPVNTVTDTVVVPSSTSTPTRTSTATATRTFTPTATITPSPVQSPTFTPTNPPPGSTFTFTPTITPTFTNSPVSTPTGTFTYTATQLPTAVSTMTYTRTSTPVQTATFTRTLSYTPTSTQTNQPVPVNTATPTFTPTVISAGTGDLEIDPPLAYPNPSQGGEVNLGFTVNKQCTRVTVRIYTTSYRLVRKAEFDGPFYANKASTVKISRGYIQGLSRGAYLYVIDAVDFQDQRKTSQVSSFFLANQY